MSKAKSLVSLTQHLTPRTPHLKPPDNTFAKALLELLASVCFCPADAALIFDLLQTSFTPTYQHVSPLLPLKTSQTLSPDSCHLTCHILNQMQASGSNFSLFSGHLLRTILVKLILLQGHPGPSSSDLFGLRERERPDGSIIMAPYAEEGCKLFVYGINESVSNSELQSEFEKFGTVTDTYNTGKG